MEDNCFIELCWFLPNINTNQPWVYIHPLPLEPTFHPIPSHPSRLSQSPRLELPVSHSKFPLALYFTYGSVYVSMLSIPPTLSFFHSVHKYVLYVCISIQFSSAAQSCPTLCDPVNHSTPGLPVHHQLPEFTQTHVHLY